MADGVPVTPAPAQNATVFTFKEELTASVSLYGMSIFCIIIGGIKSARYISNEIKKKRLLEGSITMKEAKKFPLSASAVLFGLYLFFKPAHERFNWVAKAMQKIHVPDEYVQKVNNTITSYMSNSTTATSEPLLKRIASKLPNVVKENLSTLSFIEGYFTKDNLMMLLTILICVEGLTSFASLVKPFVSCFLKKLPFIPRLLKFNSPYLLSIKKGLKEMDEGDICDAPKKDTDYIMKMEMDKHDIIACILCLPVLIIHLKKNHWITNNIIGISFSIVGIERLHLSSFKAGVLLLSGLFIYDIFWVFATDVMTSVAKGINAPILLRFPQDIYRNGILDSSKFSMLGLGDIVIPGIFIALLKRFDDRVVQSTAEKKGDQKSRYYFVMTCVAYALGLCITMGVMHYFKAAQPALLYLVPCCVLVPLFIAICRGELSSLWNYDEGMHVKKDDDPKKITKEKKTN